MNTPNPPRPEDIYRRAVEALNQNQWRQAQMLAQQVLPHAPRHGGVHFVAGIAALQLQQIPLALRHLKMATELSPQRADYCAQFARALAGARLSREAVEAADRAAALEVDDPLTLDTLGVVYSQVNAHAKAAALFKRAAAAKPDFATFRFNLATSLTFSGDVDAAEREYEACLALDPGYWKAHLALAQLRKHDADNAHLERLRSLLAQHPGDANAQMYLHLSLSKELEDLGEREASFSHLKSGKAAGKQARDYTPQRDEVLFRALEEAFPEPVSAETGHRSREPIFVIGMPRSGTTLVDRILSSHSQVQSAGELQNLGALVKRASGSRTPRMLDPETIALARNLDWKRLGEAYIGSTRPVTGQMPYFIDKLPHNFLYAGHIAQALPDARIICLRRNPMDSCLSNFRQLFAQTSPYYDYSFDLLDTGRYYIGFDRLMAHWRRVLPGRILEIDYERIVADQEGCTQELLEYCGLPWEDACMRFEENEAPVSTASAVQVREPMHRNSLQRWKRYEAQLADLRTLLEKAGIEVE